MGRRLLFAALAGLLLIIQPRSGEARTGSAPVSVRVERSDGAWSVDYSLPADAPAWIFPMSSLLSGNRAPWRPDWWRVETPGVSIVRLGAHDALIADGIRPVPRRLRLIMRPLTGDLEADYDPALLFSNGSAALYSEQFDVVPVASADAARALVRLPAAPPARISWHDPAGPILFHGRRRGRVTAARAETYVLFGPAAEARRNGLATVIDPGLPAWLGAELRAFAPAVMGLYASRLGPATQAMPALMLSWTGPARGSTTMSGGTRPGLIAIRFGGEGLLTQAPPTLARARWFFAHEAAHFWLGSTAVRYERPEDAWITEGGADLMAVRAAARLDPMFDAQDLLQRAIDDCIRLTQGRGVASARTRGEGRAYYACGTVLALAAEAVTQRQGGRDWFDFLRPLLAANRRDRVLTRAEWLAEVRRRSGDAALTATIEALLDRGAADPAILIAGLFERSGVPFERAEGGIRLREPRSPEAQSTRG